METKKTANEIVIAKLNTASDRLTELVEQDGFYYVRKEITPEQYPVIKQFYEYQQHSPSPPLLPLLQFTPSTKKRDTSISMKNGFVGKAWKNIFICKVHFQKMK